MASIATTQPAFFNLSLRKTRRRPEIQHYAGFIPVGEVVLVEDLLVPHVQAVDLRKDAGIARTCKLTERGNRRDLHALNLLERIGRTTLSTRLEVRV